ncbi:hypothetical protein [Stutzerimonas kunmingensis]|uniref:hypothetical protein n=1 Tax=Stutzerimonas kunmingensis TaxID=1211807 RepID=UPI0035E3F691
MSWLALTLVAFVIFVLVFFVKNRQLNHPALQYPYRLKAPLFSPAERWKCCNARSAIAI